MMLMWLVVCGARGSSFKGRTSSEKFLGFLQTDSLFEILALENHPITVLLLNKLGPIVALRIYLPKVILPIKGKHRDNLNGHQKEEHFA